MKIPYGISNFKALREEKLENSFRLTIVDEILGFLSACQFAIKNGQPRGLKIFTRHLELIQKPMYIIARD
ncbi:MAG: hypothetical protein LR001_09855 [Clostridiales bacterium]|nr:hypothetical protein [Clostridiales bacterium]